MVCQSAVEFGEFFRIDLQLMEGGFDLFLGEGGGDHEDTAQHVGLHEPVAGSVGQDLDADVLEVCLADLARRRRMGLN